MTARQWTDAQKSRQGELIRTWKPWEQSTGRVTQAGKKASSKNAFNCALRDVMRELTRLNRALLANMQGMARATPTFDRATINRLFNEAEVTMTPKATKPGAPDETPAINISSATSNCLPALHRM